MQSPASTPDSPSARDAESPNSVTLQMKQQYALNNQRTPPTPDVRLYHRAVVVAQDTPGICDQAWIFSYVLVSGHVCIYSRPLVLQALTLP